MLLKYLGNVMPQQVSTTLKLNLKKKIIDQCNIQIVVIIIKIYFKNIKYSTLNEIIQYY